jgi:hypothetical protein
MRTTRLITASLATALSAAALGAPAPAFPAGVSAAADLGGSGSQAPVPQQAPTWPTDPQVIPRPHALATNSGAGFDWDSAGIGAATVLGAITMGTAGVALVRRRRVGGFRLGSSH